MPGVVARTVYDSRVVPSGKAMRNASVRLSRKVRWSQALPSSAPAAVRSAVARRVLTASNPAGTGSTRATPSTSVNLDLAVTFGEDGYLSTAIGATGSLTVHPNFYVVMHTLVSVDPTVDFYLQPGAGVTHSIGATAPFVEVTAASAVGRGALDVGIGVAVGASRNF